VTGGFTQNQKYRGVASGKQSWRRQPEKQRTSPYRRRVGYELGMTEAYGGQEELVQEKQLMAGPSLNTI